MTAHPAPLNPWRALCVLCIANFVILLDTTIVNTALPNIMSTLHVGIDQALWVLNGFLLAFASLLIFFGRLGDVLGPRRMFVIGLLVFTAASVLCGLSQSPAELVAARVLQGIGAATLVPQALVLISALFQPDRRGAAFGIFTAVAGLASVSGPNLGGFLITEFGWRSVFYINLPVGLIGLALARRFVPDIRLARTHRFDIVGVLLASLGLLGIVFSLVESQHDAPTTVVTIAVLATALLVLFLMWERRQPEPLLPVALFSDRNFSIATLITAITSFSLYGFLLVFAVETQSALGMSPLVSGAAALPMTLTLSSLAPAAGRLSDRVGGRVLLIVGLALYALGVLAVAFVATGTSRADAFVLPLVLVGAGMGLALAPTTAEAMRGVSPQRAGAASGVLNTARQVGAVLGAAVIGAVLQNRLAASLYQQAQQRVVQLPQAARESYLTGFARAGAHSPQWGSGRDAGVTPPANMTPDAALRFTRLAHEAFSQGFVSAARPTLSVVAALLLLGCLLATFLVRRTPMAARLANPDESHQTDGSSARAARTAGTSRSSTHRNTAG